MEIKKFFKKSIKPIIYILSCLILGILFYSYVATSVLSIPVLMAFGLFSTHTILSSLLFPIGLIVLFFSASFILYKYLMLIITDFSKKKLLRPIILLIVLIIAISISAIFLYFLENSLKFLFLLSLYTIVTIFIPIILLGFVLFNKNYDKKEKIKKSVLSILLAIIIYAINLQTLIISTTYINLYVEQHISKQEETPNLEYLSNYEERMTTKGFLYKSDIEYIINVTALRNEKVIVNYSFDGETITISNKDENFSDTLLSNLNWEYYKFGYKYENNTVTINIEKYTSSLQEPQEKNDEIILKGSMQKNLVQNINSENIDPNSINFVLENNLNISSPYQTYISNLRLLLVYDEESSNFIPVVENEDYINMIQSYKITSTELSITLKNNTNLDVPDYTIRINRYDENLDIPENKYSSYYYYYEPGVTKSIDNNGNTVLTFEFNNILTLSSLNNIEIIFGNN